MKTYYCKILLFTVFWVLYDLPFVFCEKLCEEQKKTNALERIVEEFYSVDGHDGIRRYYFLPAHGDYTKLKLIIRSNRKDYNPGDSINIHFFVHNDSGSEVHIDTSYSMYPFAHLWKLFHSNYDEAVKMPEWRMEFQRRALKERKDRYYEDMFSMIGGYTYIKLQPGQEFNFHTSFRLNDYFDLNKPDTYELTCFLATFIMGQCYDPPLQSNTLTFRVLDKDEKADDIETGMNPPKGEEVFKQPKPPKNVFYAIEQGIRQIFIDVSPTEYYRLPAEERDAHIIKPTDESEKKK